MAKLAPQSAFETGRTTTESSGDDVAAELTVAAVDADAAEMTARWLLRQVLPSVAFTEYAVAPDVKDRVLRYPGTCSICGRGRDKVKQLVAFPDAAICDECLQMAADAMAHEPPVAEGEPPATDP
jgi:ClpX C4-type zinc finger